MTCSWYQTNTTPYTAVEFDMELSPFWNWTTATTGVGIDLQRGHA
ncbi:MAG: hypothetical protein U0531_04655 [Dehalococcoidia bacterium]